VAVFRPLGQGARHEPGPAGVALGNIFGAPIEGGHYSINPRLSVNEDPSDAPVMATMALSAPFRRGRRSCATMSAAFGADGDDLETVLRGQVCPSRHP
jgi:hypothetical protein